MRAGRSPWQTLVHLVWSVWVFLTPLFSGGEYGFSGRWFALTALTYPTFLALYFAAVFAVPRIAHACALAMVAMSFALLPWYPSGLSYFVFGCVMLQPRRAGGISIYLALLASLNMALVTYASWIGYPWQALVWIPTVTVIIGLIVLTERLNQRRDAALKLSHEEVRRLAALAERERIGRDLHDLLGHTLSMVALKSDLAAKLLDRDPAQARTEITDVGTIAREALMQVRHAVSGIRASGIAAELASAKLLLETDGIALDYAIEADVSELALPPDSEAALAMTVREAATNIQRHAREARHARIRFRREGHVVVLDIHDDGHGGPITPGHGLTGMRERLAAVGGTLVVTRPSGEGVHLQARLPVPASHRHRLGQDSDAARPAQAPT